jgi:hypothetical protein
MARRGKISLKQVTPVDGLTEEEMRMMEDYRKKQLDNNTQSAEVVEEIEVKESLISDDIDISPISFGKEFDSLPIIKVTSELPSGGISYPKNYSIYYRPFVFGEVNRVSMKESPPQDIIRVVLSGLKTSFPLENITFYDFTFLGLLRKLSSLGDTRARATHACKKCGHSNTYVVNVGVGPDSNMDFWKVKYESLPIIAELKFNNGSHKEYEFMPLTIKQYVTLCDAGLQKDLEATLAIQCSGDFDENYYNIKAAYGEDEVILRQIDELLTHGIKPIPSKCASCEYINFLRLDSSEVLFRPFRGSDEVIKNRIRFS